MFSLIHVSFIHGKTRCWKTWRWNIIMEQTSCTALLSNSIWKTQSHLAFPFKGGFASAQCWFSLEMFSAACDYLTPLVWSLMSLHCVLFSASSCFSYEIVPGNVDQPHLLFSETPIKHSMTLEMCTKKRKKHKPESLSWCNYLNYFHILSIADWIRKGRFAVVVSLTLQIHRMIDNDNNYDFTLVESER